MTMRFKAFAERTSTATDDSQFPNIIAISQ
jgi:hypothetical protein